MKKVVIYSSNSKRRDPSSSCEVFPKWTEQWERTAGIYSDMDITLVVQLNGRYFLDIKDGKPVSLPEGIHTVILPMEAEVGDFVKAVLDCEPDIAIAMTGPVSGYDWNGIRDAAIAEGIRKAGVECICFSVDTAMDCFDKCRTHRLLKDNGFNVSNAVYVNYDLFTAAKGQQGTAVNAYRDSVLWQIGQLKTPLVLKSSTGSSSIGIHISDTYEDAESYLCSEAFTEDVIVEERFIGEEYSMEIQGCSGNYIISPPYRVFWYDKSDLKDPLGAKTLKYGPVLGEAYHTDELQAEMLRLAELMGLTGIINIDLFFVDGKWYILELNSRWSGVTTLTCGSQGRLPYQVFLDQINGASKDCSDTASLKYCCQFKMPKADPEVLDSMVRSGDVSSIISYEFIFPDGTHRWFNDAVTKGCDSAAELCELYKALSGKYPELISDESAEELAADIKTHLY